MKRVENILRSFRQKLPRGLNLSGVCARINFDLIGLILIAGLIHFQLWDASVWPQHDTLGNFEGFYFFYNDLFWFGHLPRWVPYGSYGQTSEILEVMFLTPASYAAMALGWLLRIKNVLLLFKFSVFLEHLVLLFGTYLFARRLYLKRATVFFVSLGVLASTVWIFQLYLNFRAYYLLPLILYFGDRFFAEKRPVFFWIAGCLFVVSLFGNAFYFAALYLFILIPVAVIKIRSQRDILRCNLLERSRLNLAAIALLGCLCFVYFYPIVHALAHLKLYSVERNWGSLGVGLSNFLSYGGGTDIVKYLGLLYAGPVHLNSLFRPDCTVYIGLLPILFLFYAVRNSSHLWFTAVAVVALLLFSFSLADTSLVARFSFYFSPLMPFYRHIGLVKGLLRVFLLLGAGFGLDRFLLDMEAHAAGERGGASPRRTVLVFGTAILIAALLIDRVINKGGVLYPKTWPDFFYYALILFSLAVMLISGTPRKARVFLPAVIVGFFALDILSYQNLVCSTAPRLGVVHPDVPRVRRYEFLKKRSNNPHEYSAVLASALQVALDRKLISGNGVYAHALNFVQMDWCVPAPFSDNFIPDGIYRLVNLVEGRQVGSRVRALGCLTPKLEVPVTAIYPDTPKAAEEMFLQFFFPGKVAILEGVPPALRKKNMIMPAVDEPPVDVEVKSYRADELVAETDVTGGKGSWLIFMDSFHPAWKAYVNGRRVPLAQANLAFKAAPLDPGHNRVRFVFSDWRSELTSGLRMVLFLAFAFYGLVCMVRTVFDPPKRESSAP